MCKHLNIYLLNAYFNANEPIVSIRFLCERNFILDHHYYYVKICKFVELKKYLV